MQKLIFVAMVVGALCMLCSCGGGGGGPSAVNVPPDVRTVAVSSTALKNTIPEWGITVVSSANTFTSGKAKLTSYQSQLVAKPASPVAAITQLYDVESEAFSGKGTLSFTFTTPSTLQNERWIVAYQRNSSEWISLEITSSDAGHTTAKVDIAANRGISQRIRVALTKVPLSVNVTETKVALVRVAGTGPLFQLPASGTAAILTHGMNNGIEDMKLVADRCIAKGYADAVYALMYPWPLDILQNGAALAQIIRDAPVGCRITLIGHSMGGVVNRAALQQDITPGNRASDHVERVVLVAAPNKGSVIADIGGLVRDIESHNLNDPDDTAQNWGVAGSLITPSVKQIDPNTIEGQHFLATLNDGVKNHTNRAKTTLVYGTKASLWGYAVSQPLCDSAYPGEPCDGLVGASSASFLPTETTLGPLEIVSLPANHSELISSQTMVDTWLDRAYAPYYGAGPKITFQTIPSNARALDNGWDISLFFANESTGPIKITELILKDSSRNGLEFTRQGYDSKTGSGQFFPLERRSCSITIDSRETWGLDLHLYFDYLKSSYAAANDNDRAKTVEVFCSGVDGQGKKFERSGSFVVLDQAGKGPTSSPCSVVALHYKAEAVFYRR